MGPTIARTANTTIKTTLVRNTRSTGIRIQSHARLRFLPGAGGGSQPEPAGGGPGPVGGGVAYGAGVGGTGGGGGGGGAGGGVGVAQQGWPGSGSRPDV